MGVLQGIKYVYKLTMYHIGVNCIKADVKRIWCFPKLHYVSHSWPMLLHYTVFCFVLSVNFTFHIGKILHIDYELGGFSCFQSCHINSFLHYIVSTVIDHRMSF